MRFLDQIADLAVWAVTAVASALVGGVFWLFRKVLLHEKEIALLRQEMEHRDKMRQEDREGLAEVKDGVNDIRNFLMGERK